MGKGTGERGEKPTNKQSSEKLLGFAECRLISARNCNLKPKSPGSCTEIREENTATCSDDPQKKTEQRTIAKGVTGAVTMTQGQACQAQNRQLPESDRTPADPQQLVTCKSSSELVVSNPSCTH